MGLSTFSVTYPTSAQTIYAIIRQSDTPFGVWNGSALAMWSDGSIATYAVAMADESGDMYAVAVPATLPIGNYAVTYYLQAGGSPATSDTTVGRQIVQWTGASLAPPSTTIVLSPFALTTLASAKTNMAITVTNYDDKLTFLINAASAQIENITGRQFVARDYRARLNGFWQRKLVLPNPPTQILYRMAWGIATAINIGYQGPNLSVSASVYNDPESATNGGLFVQSVNNVGVTSNSNFTFAAYPTTALLCAAVALMSGFTCATPQNIPSKWMDPVALPSLMTGPQLITYPNQVWTAPQVVDYARGILTFDNRNYNYFWNGGANTGWPQWDTVMPKGNQALIVEYRGGYETIPADLQQICNEMVKESFLLSTQDTTMESETIDKYTYHRPDIALRDNDWRLKSYMDNATSIGGGMP